MLYNRCGRSGIQLPAVSLGLWHNFGGEDSYQKARSIALRAFDLGITHFDLANNYGPPPGSAEHTLGKILKEDLAKYRDEMIISTTAGYRMWEGPYGEWGSRKYLLSSLNQSLHRLGLEYVDIFYSHRPDPNTPLDETMSALASAVAQGKALYVGISNYNPESTKKACDLLRDMGTPCLIHQPRYSMLDREIESSGLLEVLHQEGVGCIVFSPLAQGLLTDRYVKGIPKDSRAGGRSVFLSPADITNEKLRLIQQLSEIANSRNQTLAQMALAWVLRNNRITSVLVGASSITQLDQNVGCLTNCSFKEDELAAIDSVLAPPGNE